MASADGRLSFRGIAPGAHVFETVIGPCGLAWTARGIDLLVLPDGDLERTRAATLAAASRALHEARPPHARTHAARPHRARPPGARSDDARALVARPPQPVRMLVRRLKAHLRGRADSFLDVPLDLARVGPFARRTYEELRRIPPGSVVTYGELARILEAPRARAPGARAIGRILGANPIPLLLPCHRVVGAKNALGGFSAAAGPGLKARLLFAEGVVLDPRHAQGIAALRKADPVLRRIIDRVGPYPVSPGRSAASYETLLETIIYQQLSMKAAATIASRVRALTPGPGFPPPAEMAAIEPARLRAAGLSSQKLSYVKDLAARVVDRRLPLQRLARMDDDAVIAALTAVRGIGRWSAQMFLLFHLGRLDVLPTGDLGFRQAVARGYGLEKATEAELTRLGERWRPYRSMATWYLWQSLRLPAGE